MYFSNASKVIIFLGNFNKAFFYPGKKLFSNTNFLEPMILTTTNMTVELKALY